MSAGVDGGVEADVFYGGADDGAAGVGAKGTGDDVDVGCAEDVLRGSSGRRVTESIWPLRGEMWGMRDQAPVQSTKCLAVMVGEGLWISTPETVEVRETTGV